jgi:hypothetical protein
MNKSGNQEKWRVSPALSKTPDEWVEDKSIQNKGRRTKRLSVEIPVEFHKALKKMAADKELKMNILVIESIKNFLEINKC